MIAPIVAGGICLWIGVAVGVAAGISARRHLPESTPDPHAVMASFNEWSATGKVSPATQKWLETGIKPPKALPESPS